MKRNLNLIPASTQRAHVYRRISLIGVRTVIASGLCVAVLLGLEWVRGLATLQELTELDAKYAPFERIAEEQSGLLAEIERLRTREQITLRLSRDNQGMALLGTLSLATAKTSGAVYLDELMYDNSATGSVRSVRLSGAGVDGVAVAEFGSELRESGLFENVAVESTRPLPGGAASLRHFTVAGSL